MIAENQVRDGLGSRRALTSAYAVVLEKMRVYMVSNQKYFCGGVKMRTETMSIKDFLNGKDSEPLKVKVERHLKKHRFVYKVVGLTIIIFITAGAFDHVSAASAIDEGARSIYKEIVGIGKWIIIIKGGFDIIKSVGNGDFEAGKKQFFSYLLTYLLLLGLPYGMDKVDSVFNSLK